MTIDHTGHASSGCNQWEHLPLPPRRASESPDDLKLMKLSFSGQIQPTVDDMLMALSRVLAGKTPPSSRVKFTKLELAHARAELHPTAVWDENGELDVRLEG